MNDTSLDFYVWNMYCPLTYRCLVSNIKLFSSFILLDSAANNIYTNTVIICYNNVIYVRLTILDSICRQNM